MTAIIETVKRRFIEWNTRKTRIRELIEDKVDPLVVHFVNWASQGDIQIACTGHWTEPGWAKAITGTKDVYLSEEDWLYTYDPSLVTCQNCISAKEMRLR